MSQRIGIASDHGGRLLKDKIEAFLSTLGFTPVDFGVASSNAQSVDYPDYAALLAHEIRQEKLPRGVLVCGTGIGMSIAANKIHGIRAALVWDVYTAKMSRQHNNANIICLGERVLNHDRALDLLRIWLDTPFDGKQHQTRLDKLHALER